MVFKLQISGQQDHFKKAEDKLIEELDNAVVKQTHSLPATADSVFQTAIQQTLYKYFVSLRDCGS